MGRPKVNRLHLFARDHPFLASIAGGLGLVAWELGVLGASVRGAAMIGGLAAVIVLVLWFPKVGPVRRYTERLLAEGDEE